MIPEDNPFFDLIPHNWPAERALALARLLQMGLDAIWDIYAEDMAVELMRPGSPWHCRIDEMTRFDAAFHLEDEYADAVVDDEIPF